LVVQDDGRGFAADSVLEGDGLNNMRERIRILGGELTMQSAPGAGAKIHALIPLQVPEPGQPG